MNERIRELAEQVNLQLIIDDGDFSLRKFADKLGELIVQECALTLESITVPVSRYYEDFDNGYNKALLTGSTVIKQHFGVKE